MKKLIQPICKPFGNLFVFAIAAFLFTLVGFGITNSGTAEAAEPAEPFVFTSTKHDAVVDKNNNVYYAVGYYCRQHDTPPNEEPVVLSDSSKLTILNEQTGTGLTSQPDSGSECSDIKDGTKGQANFAWSTKNVDGSANYVITWYQATGPPYTTDNNFDHKTTTKNLQGTLGVYQMGKGRADGLMLGGNAISDIRVDTSKQKVVDEAKKKQEADLKDKCTADPNQSGCQVTCKDGSKSTYGNCPEDIQLVEDPDSCLSGVPSFGWMLCPVLAVADVINDEARDVISGILYVSSDMKNDDGLQASWRIMRNLSSALLVLVALFMIAGQIFSFDFMSAYTVKKVLPRLVIAAILIQLSWFIFTTMIALMNSLGVGLYSLLTYPFTQGGNGTILDLVGTVQKSGGWATSLTATGLFAGLVTASAVGIVAVTSGGALLTLIVAAIGVIISLLGTLFTLIVRKSLILILLVLAPLALVAWILPGTQRYWDMWWKLFSKLLLMYPLIMLLFAAGTIGASITANQTAPGPFEIITVIVMFFAPLFLIPATFKFAGGMFTSITSAIDKTSSKAKNSGMFGLRDQAKADKEYANAKKDQRARQLLGKQAAGENVGKFASFNARRRAKAFNTGIGASARGDFAKRAQQIAQAGVQEFDKELAENAQTEFKNAYETVTAGDRIKFVEALHRADVGEEFTVGGRTYHATAAMKIGGAEAALGYKKQHLLKNSIEKIRASSDADSKRLLERTLSQPTFDEHMTDYLRGKQIGAVGPDGSGGDVATFNAMFGKYNKMDGGDNGDTGTRQKLREQTALQGTTEVKADRLYRAATNPDLHEEDFELFAKTFQEKGQGTITKETMLAVQQAKGGLTLAFDPTRGPNGEYVAVNSSSVKPAPTPSGSGTGPTPTPGPGTGPTPPAGGPGTPPAPRGGSQRGMGSRGGY